MGWKPLTTIQLTTDWQFSVPTDADHFRFNLTVPSTVVELLRVDIAQSFFNNNQVDFFNEQSVEFDKENSTILSLIKPYGLTERRIAVRKDTRFYASPPWLLSVDSFVYEDATQDLTNYLLERFQGLIPLFSETDLADAIAKKLMVYFNLTDNNGSNDCGDNTQLIPRQTNIPCEKGIPILIAAGNKKRRSLTIKNYGNKPLILGRSAEVDSVEGTITDVTQRFESIPPGKGFPFPVDEGCIYKGDVFALPRFNGEIEVIEWTKEIIPEQEPEGE